MTPPPTRSGYDLWHSVQTEELEKPPVPEEVIRERILFPSGLMPAMRELAAMQNIAQKRDKHSMPINLFIISMVPFQLCFEPV